MDKKGMMFMPKQTEFNDGIINYHHAYDEKPDPSIFTMHNHSLYEIYFFISGRGKFYIEGSEYPLNSGDVLIMNSNEAHHIAIEPTVPYERFALHFKRELVCGIDPSGALVRAFEDRQAGKNNLYVKGDFKDDMYLHLINNIINSDHDDLRIRSVTNLFALLNEISIAYNTAGKNNSENETVVYRIIRYINSHLGQPLSLDDICSRFFISKAQLCRVFKKTTGAAVWEYITVKRLSLAREMILSGKSAASACEDSGFGDYSAFFRAYKKQFGYSPAGTFHDFNAHYEQR